MPLDQDVGLLAALPAFAAFEREGLRLVAFSAEGRILRAGDVLFRLGEPSDGGFLVTSGSVALDPSDDGAPGVVVVGRGALIGEAALLAPGRRPATAVAREPSTVLRVPRALMLRALDLYPEAASRLRASKAQELGETRRALARAAALLGPEEAGPEDDPVAAAALPEGDADGAPPYLRP